MVLEESDCNFKQAEYTLLEVVYITPAGVLAPVLVKLRCRGRGAGAAVCRDHNGGLIGVAFRNFIAGSPEEAEMRAAEVAALLGRELKLCHVIIEGDCLKVITSLEEKGNILSWDTEDVYNSIQQICSDFSSFNFQHCNRGANGLAHEIAQWAMDKTKTLPDIVGSALRPMFAI